MAIKNKEMAAFPTFDKNGYGNYFYLITSIFLVTFWHH